MEAKNKAKELVDKYFYLFSVELENTIENYEAKQCALIAVDEAIEVCPYISKEYCDTVEQIRAYDIQFISYWQEVKKEIELL